MIGQLLVTHQVAAVDVELVGVVGTKGSLFFDCEFPIPQEKEACWDDSLLVDQSSLGDPMHLHNSGQFFEELVVELAEAGVELHHLSRLLKLGFEQVVQPVQDVHGFKSQSNCLNGSYCCVRVLPPAAPRPVPKSLSLLKLLQNSSFYFVFWHVVGKVVVDFQVDHARSLAIFLGLDLAKLFLRCHCEQLVGLEGVELVDHVTFIFVGEGRKLAVQDEVDCIGEFAFFDHNLLLVKLNQPGFSHYSPAEV